MPSSSFPEVGFLQVPGMDKLVHFLMYGGYVGLACWAAFPEGKARWGRAAVIVAYCSMFGLCMEVLQLVLRPGDRSFSLGDAAANLLGAGVAVGVFILVPGPWKSRGRGAETD